MKINKENFTSKAAKTLLSIIYFLSWLAVGGFISLMILSLTWKRFVVLEVEFYMHTTGDVTKIGEVIYNLHSFSGNLSITNSSLITVLIWTLPFIVISCSVIYAVKQLLNIVRTIQPNGNPFIPENGKRIRRIALLFFVLPPLMTLRNYILYNSLPDKLIVNGMEIQKSNPFYDEFFNYLIYFSVGLVLLLIAQVFYEGNKFDLTV